MIHRLPKAELHIHIEGSLEPELMFRLAARNGLKLPYASVEELHAAYRFSNLQEFLDLYYQGMNVLREEEDFFDLTRAYLDRVAADNVVHVEVFFDPQAHTGRGVPFAVAVEGILKGLEDGETRHGITWKLIPNFLRHLPEEDGFKALAEAEPWYDRFAGFGLDSSELGHPPRDFARLFARCRELGFKLCCHAGEEGPPDYVRQALVEIGVDRIDHGNRAMEDPDLVREIAERGVALTSCPLSNLSLKVIDTVGQSPVKQMLDAGLCVTVNSDDPSYFGGYVGDNLKAVAEAFDLSKADVVALVKNSFAGSFLDDGEKARRLAEVDMAAA
ncbi:adenosine deaminase [Rhodobium orientis]|uniref:Adenine deaminase n=1 Tax=Rhodobium orientis TaxID=34017 RepID=A0A327JNK5_9HYPH|nr:adenosine deaminase [Rhodobium orientis]MBB4302009.1 adenosine deaminase [Rhodobium orientis]MBK5950246.1 adenosine deaminase [Rhodobium orientis]RAI27156.1 adenosine deaminase [Rhodobium orientis]